MTSTSNAAQFDLGIEVLGRTPVDVVAPDAEDYEPASGRHRPSPSRPHVILGSAAVAVAARAVGQQISAVITETLAGLDGQLLETHESGLYVDGIQMSFGLKLTVGSGKIVEAVVSAGGEASVTVTVTLARQS